MQLQILNLVFNLIFHGCLDVLSSYKNSTFRKWVLSDKSCYLVYNINGQLHICRFPTEYMTPACKTVFKTNLTCEFYFHYFRRIFPLFMSYVRSCTFRKHSWTDTRIVDGCMTVIHDFDNNVPGRRQSILIG